MVCRLKALAARRTLDDLTIGPVLTWTTEAMLDHVKVRRREGLGKTELFRCALR